MSLTAKLLVLALAVGALSVRLLQFRQDRIDTAAASSALHRAIRQHNQDARALRAQLAQAVSVDALRIAAAQSDLALTPLVFDEQLRCIPLDQLAAYLVLPDSPDNTLTAGAAQQ